MKVEDFHKHRMDNKRINQLNHTKMENEKPSASAKNIFDRKPYYMAAGKR